MCFICIIYSSNPLKLPGPRVYVVTPATELKNEGRSAPFYYQNWMRRMDPPKNASTITTSKPKTHDLIFAEFESDKGNNMRNSIRKLLEKEKLDITTPTTTDPHIKYHVEATHNMDSVVQSSDKNDNNYESMYPNLSSNVPALMYLPSTTSRPPTVIKPTTPKTISTPKIADTMDVKNIWHIIDEQNKYNQHAGKWEEHDIPADGSKNEREEIDDNNKAVNTFDMDNFALPGINPTSTSTTENESRAIRTEANVNFPYVNLKTIQMKRPNMDMSQMNKKGQPMYSNLDNFRDVKYPVKGEAQDVVSEQIDRYNSAIPYFQTNKNSKQSAKPVKTVSSLVPPPPPKAGSFFPPPNTYESFPPYPPSFSAPSGPPAKPPPSLYRPPPSITDDSDSPPIDSDDSDGPPSGYQYSPPTFAPTIVPPAISMSKPFTGYSYEKPPVADDSPPMDGYSYPKPSAAKRPANFPSLNFDHDHDDHPEHPPHDTEDYPELVYDKHKDNEDDGKGGDMMNEDAMDMAPPPPPDMKDHGFPHDFPGYSHDEDDFYHDHHYHHPTTTTTETPRVNRYSYYYLGKKLYYIPLYFSAYFVAYVASLVIKSVLRHKIVYPNSYKTNEHSATFFSKRSVRSAETGSWKFSDEKLHEVTRIVTDALYNATEKYLNSK